MLLWSICKITGSLKYAKVTLVLLELHQSGSGVSRRLNRFNCSVWSTLCSMTRAAKGDIQIKPAGCTMQNAGDKEHRQNRTIESPGQIRLQVKHAKILNQWIIVYAGRHEWRLRSAEQKVIKTLCWRYIRTAESVSSSSAELVFTFRWQICIHVKIIILSWTERLFSQFLRDKKPGPAEPCPGCYSGPAFSPR